MDFYCRFPGMKPARKVITTSPQRTVGAVHANWFQDGPIHHESDLEADVIKVLLMAPTVRRIQHQPVRLTYLDGETERKHFPDLGLTLADGTTAYVEVKPKKFVPEHLVKFNACAALLRKKDVDYFVVTDEQVGTERAWHAQAIHESAKRAAPADALTALVDWVRERRSASVADVLGAGFSEPLLQHAVGRRQLLTDPSLELNPGSWLTTQDIADELLSLASWLGCTPWPPSTTDNTESQVGSRHSHLGRAVQHRHVFGSHGDHSSPVRPPADVSSDAKSCSGTCCYGGEVSNLMHRRGPMRIYSLTKDLVIRRGDRTRRLERHLEDGQLVFVDQVSGTPHTMTPGALQRLVLAGDLEIVSGDPASEAPTGVSAPLVKTLDDLPEHQAKEVRRRYRYVIYMKRKGLRRGMHARIAHALAGLNGKVPMGEAKVLCENDPHPPCASTVMEWMKRWETSGGNLMSLLTRHAVRVTPKRLDPRVLAIGRAKVRTFYCTKRRPTINDTQEEIEKELKDKRLDIKTISISTVRRLIQEICPYERDVARFGAAYARHKWRYSLKGIGADRPMQRYEIDHTVLDIVVICDRTGMPLGRPTITIVVDAFSGLVAGIFISFWGTGLAATLSALKVAISPKDEYVTRNSLAANWLPYGIPGLMVVDNGLEFHSPQFHDIAMYLNMDLRFCAVRQPWLKPFVERTLGELHGYLPHQGRVEKRLNNYLPPKPEKSATITFGSLCTGVLKAFVEIHPFELNERKLWLPFDRFSEGMEKLLPPSLPTSTAELDLIVAVTKEYTVGNEGVVPNYLRFNSGELQDLRRAVGTDFRTLIKFNPEDLSVVHVQDPRTKGWLPVQSCMPEYTDGLSIVQHKAIRAQMKGKIARKDVSDRLLQARTELTELWNTSAAIGKRLQAAQLRALSGLTSSHALRGAAAAATGAPPAPPPAPTPERLLTPEDLKVPEIEVPDFDTYMAV